MDASIQRECSVIFLLQWSGEETEEVPSWGGGITGMYDQRQYAAPYSSAGGVAPKFQHCLPLINVVQRLSEEDYHPLLSPKGQYHWW